MDERYRALAAAVLLLAVRDAHMVRRGGANVRAAARAFLDPGDEMFRVYCGLLGYDQVATAEAARRNGRAVVRAHAAAAEWD